MNQSAAQTLNQSEDPAEMVQAAARLAASAEAADHAALTHALSRGELIERLNTPQDYDEVDWNHLRVAAVIKALRDNPSPSAANAIGQLMSGGAFPEHQVRQELLLRASIRLRPPPSACVRFWSQHVGPESALLNLVVVVLCENGTREAIGVLEQAFLDQRHDPILRRGWMRGPVLSHRNDTPLLEGCERLTQVLPDRELRLDLVEVLCDYDRDWYTICTPPEAPARALMTDPSRTILLRICRDALNWPYMPKPLAAKVKVVMEGLDSGESGAGRPRPNDLPA